MKRIIFLAISLAMAGCSSNYSEHWTNFSNTGINHQVTADRAEVVFYRLPNTVEGKAVNIYVNEEYLASLLPGAFQTATICPNNQRVHAEFTALDINYSRKHNVGENYDLAAGRISYFEVIPDAQYGVRLNPVDSYTGEAAVSNLKRQNHTLPRLDKQLSCETSAPVKQYILDASALFHFDKSDYANMLPKGKADIQAVAQDITQFGAKVNYIEVIGHTDPDGSEQYNERLSYSRAETVKQALIHDGINSNIIRTSGMGEHQLIITDCAARFPNDDKARKACNQPNRRVEINLY